MRRYLILIVLITSLPALSPAQNAVFRQLPVEKLEQRLRRVAPNNRGRHAALKEMFLEAGCQPDKLTEQKVKGTDVPNILCTTSGESEALIIVGGHYDNHGHGPGLTDNWTGSVLLTALMESLGGRARHHTYVFVAFAGEEEGLLGSRSYARELRKSGVQVRAVVNLDTVGLGPTKVWASRADPGLVQALARVAHAMKLPLEGVNVEQVGTTDSESFAILKVPRITIHSLTQETLPLLHTALDSWEALRLNDYYDTYRLTAAFLALLDLRLQQETSSTR